MRRPRLGQRRRGGFPVGASGCRSAGLHSGRMRRLLVPAIAALVLVLADTGAAAGLQPNDPAWPDEWAQRLIRLPDVWEITTGDPSIVIATIDTGVNAVPDLEGALVPGWDFVENDDQPQDTQGHGTQVASVIAARGNNGIGMAGHCWQCRIMPVRVTAGGSVTPEQIAAGVTWAVEHGARIIDISLTHPGQPNSTEREAVRYAIDRGVLVVASAGNNGNEVPQYPAAYPGVLAVGATDDSDALYFWSARGPWVSLTAPGCHLVLSLTFPPGTLCGTSFTPAAVAGVAGLILSRNPSLTVQQVGGALLTTAHSVPGVSAGRIDAYAAFEALGLLPKAEPVKPPPVRKTERPPAPGQLFTRQAQLASGTFRRVKRIPVSVGKGRLEITLATPRASECSMSLRSPSELIAAAPAVKNLLSLSALLPRGRYTIEVRCRGWTKRDFAFGIIAMFPRGAEP
jgi:subtilisin family serine protease